ncbi:hypothetical protein [Haloarcula litorea]|uniref:hypothetical protein n=1 Tax=Haloarcula litorea TaxID=3032579 RepID=UPI0023E7D580|nr:hypothetical protein [Halomicroarcula sp. GDY20]
MSADGDSNRATLAVAAGVALLGLASLAGLVYADATADVSRADFAEYRGDCAALAGETRLVDAGLGWRRVTLNESHVRACRNTTYAEYRRQRTRSLRTAPFSPLQWLLYGGFAGGIAVGGAILVRQELRRG